MRRRSGLLLLALLPPLFSLFAALSADGPAAVGWGAQLAHAAAAQPDRLKAMHAIHGQNEVDCSTCHAGVETSQAGTDNLLPTMEACGTCHDVADTEKCGQCHTNVEAPAAAVRRVSVAQRFPHQTHVDAGVACADCHGDATHGEPTAPQKAMCRTCHETASDYGDCQVCHAAGEEMTPVSHVPGWVSMHGASARLDQATCETCHTQKDCQDCHAGDNVRPRTHGLNFAFDHALEARSSELECASCHEDRNFCTSCHASERVLPQNHSASDWVLGVALGGGRHAVEGRFDLESCVACHDGGVSAPVCANCHGN